MYPWTDRNLTFEFLAVWGEKNLHPFLLSSLQYDQVSFPGQPFFRPFLQALFFRPFNIGDSSAFCLLYSVCVSVTRDLLFLQNNAAVYPLSLHFHGSVLNSWCHMWLILIISELGFLSLFSPIYYCQITECYFYLVIPCLRAWVAYSYLHAL